uniref:Uncharacterized protein n=1 Tax=Anguilla anguilla TaxID=7936 RepID=A0A0E9VQU7_ANGAN
MIKYQFGNYCYDTPSSQRPVPSPWDSRLLPCSQCHVADWVSLLSGLLFIACISCTVHNSWQRAEGKLPRISFAMGK